MTTPARWAYKEKMHRVIGVSALVVCACLVAGCGGSSPQAAGRRDASKLFGDPHARVVHVETFTNLSGTHEAVVTMQGHFSSRSDNPLASGPGRFRYVALDFLLPPGPATSAGFETLTPSMIAATTRARSANPLFKIFPDIGSPAIRCLIPRGGPSPGTILGGCLTNTDLTPSNHVRRVEFLERWPLVKKRNGSWPSSVKGGGWIVTLSRDGRVQSIRVTGHLPPQLWK